MLKLIKFIISLFKSKKEIEFPYEFVIVNYTQPARESGVFEDYTKEIRKYAGTEYLSYEYNESLIKSLKEKGMPIYDMTQKKLELPIIKVINPQILKYKDVKN